MVTRVGFTRGYALILHIFTRLHTITFTSTLLHLHYIYSITFTPLHLHHYIYTITFTPSHPKRYIPLHLPYITFVMLHFQHN